jgi:hypothetical protein
VVKGIDAGGRLADGSCRRGALASRMWGGVVEARWLSCRWGRSRGGEDKGRGRSPGATPVHRWQGRSRMEDFGLGDITNLGQRRR